ncbi:MAG: hypothetical protein QMC98_00880 [Candidatus Thermoplasmatota archaeon]|nr:hypothetical protein [Candidatus Thermoplasmatota archaeon]
MVKLKNIVTKETFRKAADKEFIMETLTDETLEPHLYLAILIIIVIIVSLIIALVGI